MPASSEPHDAHAHDEFGHDHPLRVFVLGDSISVHYGLHLKVALAKRAWGYARKSGVEEALRDLDNGELGANGGDSNRCLAYLRGEAAAGDERIRGSVILLNCGLHDLRTDPATGAKQVPIDKYESNLRELIEVARRDTGAAAVVWMRITPVDDVLHNSKGQPWHRHTVDVDAYNAVADRVMEELSVPVIDLHAATVALGPDLYCDHVHYHDSVRVGQAEFIARWVVERFPDGPPDGDS